MSSFDLTIIGAGPGGYVAAIRAAQLGAGAKICVVEKDELGGVCLNRGCIPTKALLKTAEVMAEVRAAEEFGINIFTPAIEPVIASKPGADLGSAKILGPTLDLKRAMERKDQVVKTLVRGIDSLFKSWKITTIKGTAKFVGRDKIFVATGAVAEEISAGAFIIATGSESAQIPLFPIDGNRILTSDHLLKMIEVPKSILIIGAGAIGCEWAFIMKNFGAEVTVIEMLDQVAPTEDEMIGTLLAREMKKLKIKIILSDKIVKVDQGEDGVTAKTESGQELKAQKMLVSIGRAPNSKGIGLEAAGVETDARGFVKVNARLETSVQKIYAIGDVAGGMLLAHKASAEGKVAVANALGKNEEMDYSVIPAAIFTSPEVASVGLREKDAKEKGINYATSSFPIRALGKAQAMGEIAGEIKMVFDKGSLQLLGCHIIGARASDLIHEAALAIKMGAKISDIADTIHAHPTLSEGLMEAAEAGLGMAIHLPKSKS